eukprot:scaffold42925_cov27-Phaeocystis_antarctica.AAC.1
MHGERRGARSPGTQWVVSSGSWVTARGEAISAVTSSRPICHVHLVRVGGRVRIRVRVQVRVRVSVGLGFKLGLGFHPPAPARGESEAEP